MPKQRATDIKYFIMGWSDWQGMEWMSRTTPGNALSHREKEISHFSLFQVGSSNYSLGGKLHNSYNKICDS